MSHPGGCSCCADAFVDDGVLGSEDLNAYIVSENVVCLNESTTGAAKTMLGKGWCHKLDEEPFLESDADEQLIITIEFTAAVKLKSITVVGSTETDSNPADMKAFLNRDDVDFDNVDDLDPVQEWTLPERNDERLEFPTNFAKFQNVQTLVLYFPSNHGADETKLLFLGFRGVATNNKRQVVEAVYESRAMLADHKVPGAFASHQNLGM